MTCLVLLNTRLFHKPMWDGLFGQSTSYSALCIFTVIFNARR